MSSNEIVKKIIEEDKQQQIKPIGEPESYLTSFKGIQRFLANECQNLGKSRPSKPCLLYTSPSPRDATLSRMPSSA